MSAYSNLNNPRNIAEFVVKKVIEENKYRDDEIKKLQEVLKEFSIVKCEKCKEYNDAFATCDMCDDINCYKCATIKHYDTWNLSGMDMCNNCSLIYCHWCLKKKETNHENCLKCQSGNFSY